MLSREQRRGVVSYKVQIAASKARERRFVRETLGGIGVKALELKDRFTFSNRRIYEAMERLGLAGKKAHEKFVPEFVFRCDAPAIKEFLLGHFMGDGSEQKGVRAHYTCSARLADGLQRLIFLSGQESHVAVREARSVMTGTGRAIVGRYPEHRVSVCERKGLSVERLTQISVEQYAGEVFCAEVPTHHTLVTRRNGKILVSGNCTANAAVGAVEYLDNRNDKTFKNYSRLFLYYNERKIEHTTRIDSGAYIRDAVKALARYGVCTEETWPYHIGNFTVRPSLEAYHEANGYVGTDYLRVNQTQQEMLSALALGYPIILGFSVYESFESEEVARTGVVPMPSPGEKLLGGHAVLAVGYDKPTRRFICRNSWGEGWGDKGYFYMPFDYLTNSDLAEDMWCIEKVTNVAMADPGTAQA